MSVTGAAFTKYPLALNSRVPLSNLFHGGLRLLLFLCPLADTLENFIVPSFTFLGCI